MDPQDDVLSAVISRIGQCEEDLTAQGAAGQLDGERFAANAGKVSEFRARIQQKVKLIQELVGQVRKEIDENRGTHDNFGGFLLGETDDYLSDFAFEVAKMNEQLAHDEKYWETYASNAQARRQTQAIEMRKMLEKFKKELALVVFQNAAGRHFDFKKYPLKKWPAFGEANNQDDVKFQWPKPDDLERLKLSAPPQLKEIRVRGTNSHGLCYIQLCFKGYDSPEFKVERSEAGPVKTYAVDQSKRITHMIGRVNLKNNLNQMKLMYEGDEQDDIIIFHSNGEDKTTLIPPNHVIVGMHGNTTAPNGARICAIGFITMDISEFKKKEQETPQ